jgi:hypothetical protein
MVSTEENHDKFLQLEDDLNLFNLRIEGVPFWERVRFSIFDSILQQTTGQESLAFAAYSARKKFRFYISSMIDILRNPFLAGTKDMLFVGSQRRTLRNDGRWWDIYTDPIINQLGVSYVAIEYDFGLHHSKPPRTANLRHFDFLFLLARLLRLLGLATISLSDDDKQQLRRIRFELQKRFNVDIQMEKIVLSMLQKRKALLPLYLLTLKRIKPKVVIVVVSYGKEDFIEACKRLHIHVVELQHGSIGPLHLGYAYPGEQRFKRTFPDYLLVFSDYWANCTEYPISRSRVISVGYPYMEEERKKHAHTPRKKQILFLSQGPIGEVLSKFALELSQACDLGYEILYKLHPRECKGWKEKYPWLLSSNIKVIDTQEAVLYGLFAESIIQVGVCSTALYEGITFGLQTYMLDAPGFEYARPLLETGLVHKVSSAEDLLRNIKSRKSDKEFDTEHFFKKNAIANILSFLNGLIQRVKGSEIYPSLSNLPGRQVGAEMKD